MLLVADFGSGVLFLEVGGLSSFAVVGVLLVVLLLLLMLSSFVVLALFLFFADVNSSLLSVFLLEESLISSSSDCIVSSDLVASFCSSATSVDLVLLDLDRKLRGAGNPAPPSDIILENKANVVLVNSR